MKFGQNLVDRDLQQCWGDQVIITNKIFIIAMLKEYLSVYLGNKKFDPRLF